MRSQTTAPRLPLGLTLAAIVLASCAPQAPARAGWPAAAVRTVPTAGLLDGPDGAAADARGDVFIANWGGGRGSTLVRIPRDGAPHVFARGLRAPDGVTVGPDGLLYVSNFGDGTVSRVAADGSHEVFARGLGRPSGLTFGPDGALYVADFGNYDGTVVRRVERDGGVSVFARGFSAPIGIAFDRAGRLHVSNFGSGEVHRVSADGADVRVLARVSNTPRAMLQYVVFDGDGTLLVPSYGHHRIYRVGTDGAVGVAAGAGRRDSTDGPADAAAFDGPNSIVHLPDGTLLVTEYNANRARVLTGLTATPRD